MISGRQALASIDQSVSDAHAEIRRVEQEIRATSDLLVGEQRSELETLWELAGLHVDWLAADGVADQLEHADRQVLALLEQRDEAHAALDALQPRVCKAGQENQLGAWYAGIGTETSKGTKVFALAGKVNLGSSCEESTLVSGNA